ncbi:DUF3923 family protein [Lactobacillus sp. Sy-1]|uniref:DUF3923 family protein n=1 Tax=Lactobacillus sp. Sy-1 TaxID=2109645 RepID=UPI001C58E707|nr:DUF3923 family protein [Lactobacillus sp. Sy-1]MBW1605055.1 DUF3923 family protein [Lactobacillus sp. Sy-1]
MNNKFRDIFHGIEIIVYLVGMYLLLTRKYDGSGVEQTTTIKMASVAILSIFMAIIQIIEFFFQFWTNLIKRRKWSQGLGFSILMLMLVGGHYHLRHE